MYHHNWNKVSRYLSRRVNCAIATVSQGPGRVLQTPVVQNELQTEGARQARAGPCRGIAILPVLVLDNDSCCDSVSKLTMLQVARLIAAKPLERRASLSAT